MARPFRFGVQMRSFDDVSALREYAQMVEDLGYHELWSFDHIGEPDPFLPLMVAADATTTLRFGPLVINNELHNPVLLARSAATFDVLSGGRLTLGLGTGYAQSEHEAAGIPLRRPGPRVTRFGESVRALRELLDHGHATMDGSEVSIDLDDLGVRPTQSHVPILVGGHGRRVVGLAGELADIYQFTGLTHNLDTGEPSPGGFALADVQLRRDWIVASDRAEEIEMSALVQVAHLGDGADEVAAGISERTGLVPEAVAATPFMLVGSLDEVVDKLRRQRDELGISHIVIRDAEAFAPVVAALSGT